MNALQLAKKDGSVDPKDQTTRISTDVQVGKDETYLDRHEIMRKEMMQTVKVNVSEPMNLTAISGVPEEHITERRVRIYKPPKNAMQSGTNDTHQWILDFEQRQRWENPTMGWASTGDPLSNMRLKFTEQEDAVAFCEKNGWAYLVEEARERKPLKPSYAANFAWNKRSRVGTK